MLPFFRVSLEKEGGRGEGRIEIEGDFYRVSFVGTRATGDE